MNPWEVNACDKQHIHVISDEINKTGNINTNVHYKHRPLVDSHSKLLQLLSDEVLEAYGTIERSVDPDTLHESKSLTACWV